MANTYLETSLLVRVPGGRMEEAEQLADSILNQIENEYGFRGILTEPQGPDLWIHSDEYAEPESLERLCRELAESLKLDDPILCSWAYYCSKPSPDEFGGGAFVVQRGVDTVRVDARQEAWKQFKELKEKQNAVS